MAKRNGSEILPWGESGEGRQPRGEPWTCSPAPTRSSGGVGLLWGGMQQPEGSETAGKVTKGPLSSERPAYVTLSNPPYEVGSLAIPNLQLRKRGSRSLSAWAGIT